MPFHLPFSISLKGQIYNNFFFWAKEGHSSFLQAVPGKEGEKI